MTFAPTVWYRSYAVQAAQWSLSPLEDQQLEGLLMWVPAGVLLLVLGLGLFAAWLGEAEQLEKYTSSHTPRRFRVSEPG